MAPLDFLVVVVFAVAVARTGSLLSFLSLLSGCSSTAAAACCTFSASLSALRFVIDFRCCCCTRTHTWPANLLNIVLLYFSLFICYTAKKKIVANCWCKFISPLLFFLLFFYCAAEHTNTNMQALLGILCVYAACVYVHTRTRYVFRTSLCCQSTHMGTQIQAPNTLHSPTHKHTQLCTEFERQQRDTYTTTTLKLCGQQQNCTSTAAKNILRKA